MDEQLKLDHKTVAVVDRARRTLLWYNMDKPGSSYAPLRIFTKKKEDEKFQQKSCAKMELEEFVYPLDVINPI